MRFTSRRNYVTLREKCVRKHFASVADWQRELDIYRRIPEHAPAVLHAVPGVLLLEYCPHPHLLDVLETQEVQGFDPVPWRGLCRWIETVQGKTGCIPGDGNLRNFLWDSGAGRIVGLDFEHYIPGEISGALLRLSAFLLEYNPADTTVKRAAAAILAENGKFAEEDLCKEREILLKRRRERRRDFVDNDFSMILLAGGKSRRMGRDKAELPFMGSSLLEFQSEKAELLGIGDLMISGDRTAPSGARAVPDQLPDRGPLGGLYSCLLSAKRDRCIVLGVDTPLIPAALLRELAEVHLSGKWQATVAVHEGRPEPLIGVYDRSAAAEIEPLIRQGGAPVRLLLERLNVKYHCVERADIWKNCNTPSDYEALVSMKNV